MGVVIPTLAMGQATLLPDAKQQYFDDSGNPVASGQVFYYVPSTSTKKNVWLDPAEATLSTNPVILDAAGRPQPTGQTFGSGSYRQKVVDANGITIWDAVTYSTGSGTGPTPPNPATGDGNLVGTVLSWSGWSLPNQYMFADGHVVSRTAYPELLAALTHTVSVICTVGLPTLTGIPFDSTFNVGVGSTVEASCLPPGSTVISKAANSLTMSANATVSTAVSAQIFFFGDGDRATTFNLPDLRGSVAAGMDAMSTAVGARAVLIPPYFPQNGLGAATASPSTTLLLANLPPITPAGTIANGAITNTVTGGVNGGTTTNTTVAAAGAQFLSTSTAIAVSSSQATSTFTGSVGGGSSTPISVIQPTMMLNYIIKVTPDANSSVATGVLSLGGMTGTLACGTGIVCTGNVVSLNGTPIISPGVATVGNIAFWLDTAATTLGASPGFVTSNPGKAAIYSQLANPANGYTTVFNGFQFSQGTPIPASKQFGVNIVGLQQAVVGTLNIASGDTTSVQGNAVAGYVQVDQGVPAGGVGVFGQASTSVANASLFGMNAIAQNLNPPSTSGFNVNYIAGMEVNPNLWKLASTADPTVGGGHFYGINVQGGGNITGPIIGSAGIIINNAGFTNLAKWDSGLQTAAGAATNGIVLGAATTGASQGSQGLLFRRTDSGSNEIAGASLTGNSAGGLAITPIAGAGVSTSNLTVTGAFTATGLVTNADLTNSATTVNGQTCTLGSTCTVTAPATSITVGTTAVNSGTTTRVLYDNAGLLGEYTNTQLTALINPATATLPGTLPAWPNNTTTVFRGDGTYANVTGSMMTNNTVTTTQLQQLAGFSVLGVAGSSTANMAAITASVPNQILRTDLSGTTIGWGSINLASSAAVGVSILPAGNGGTGVSSLGTGVPTALGVNVGTAGAFVVNGGALGTPTSGVATNLTGTAAGLTAGSVTTNANLTGPIASSGNTTSITSQTGTGTRFVVDTFPTIITPTFTTSATVPLVIGGAGTTGTQLSLQTTTGVGTTDAFAFKGGNNGATTFATLQTGSLNLQTGSTFSINGTSVLSGTTLGSGVTASSLTSLGTIGTLTATNINAFTLAGTISGGGNNLNNIIIGATTPLAITGTTVTANTSHVSANGTAGGYIIKSTAAANDGSLYEDASNKMTLKMASASGTNIYRIINSINNAVYDYGDTNAGAHTFVSGGVYIQGITNVATTSAVCINVATGFLSYDGTLGTCTVSDERLKNMGERIPDALARLLQIDGRYYTWKDPAMGNGRQIGVGAQTVERAFPELVQTDANGTKSADYARLTAPIIEALRELKADLVAAHNEINELKTKLKERQ